MARNQPLIITIQLDPRSHLYFTQLRNQYYPKHCNYLEAHLTLFHKLPAGNGFILKTVKETSYRPAIDLKISAVKNMGKGVAFEAASEELMELHAGLQCAFSPFLIKKDRQKLWPHITIQNSVTAYKAAQTFKAINENFEPFSVKATAIACWLYMGAAWHKESTYSFNG